MQNLVTMESFGEGNTNGQPEKNPIYSSIH